MTDYKMTRTMKAISIMTGVVLFVSFESQAQLGGLIKKGKDKTGAFVKKQKETASSDRDKLDSTDFNYALSVIDNSGIMNIKDNNERLVKAKGLVMEKAGTETPAQKCRDILDIAEKFYEIRQYKRAEAYFIKAKDAYEKADLTENINYTKALADLGLLYSTMGRYSTAEEFIVEALNLRLKNLGENSPAYTSSVNNRGMLYQETARYSEAEADFNKARELTAKVIDEDSQEHAIVLNNQAILFGKIGRLDDAIANLTKAIEILESKKDVNLFADVGFQSNLALLYQQTGKLEEAETIYLDLEKKLNLLYKNNPYYAGVLNSLALLYIQMNKPEKVEEFLKKSADVYKSRLGEETPNYAKVINDLGNFYRRQGRFDEAEASLQKAMTIREKTLGKNHPDYVSSQEDLGILYWKKGEVEKAYPLFTSAMTASLDFVNRYFPPMSEAEKTKYWDVLVPRFQRFYNYALDASAKKPEIAQDMFDYQIATKALLLSSTNKIKQTILNSKDAALIKEYLTWLDQKETLARLYAYSKAELNEQKINLDSLERATNTVERSLSQRSKDFSQGYSTERISYKEIGSLLGDNDAVVEVIRLRGFDKDFTQDSKYAALVLTKGAAQPKLVVMDNGNQLETRYAKFYKNSIIQKSADEYSYDQFWARLDPELAAKKTIYFSPDGVFNQINISTLKKKDGDYVLNRYDVVILGNSKDLIAIKKRKAGVPKKDAFLLGFPDYGGTAVAALPGTKVELDGLSRILKTSGYKVTQFLQKDASEKNLKAVQGPTLMHIATHGYFLADADVGTGAIGVTAENARNNPLLRSGLLLAGASATMSGKAVPDLESNDNGVLTAYEAMNLNLEGTELIIMSACETGLGDVRAGEGVYGLQRAFQVAGAKALIMSLWKVDDAATQQLMTNFYTNFVKTGNKLKAFKQAQVQLMTKFKEPYYWGAFVILGE
jgi:CHAT domain-containing protein/Tfp pilus assembly protein PilF